MDLYEQNLSDVTPSAYRKKKKETVDNQESMLENYILQ